MRGKRLALAISTLGSLFIVVVAIANTLHAESYVQSECRTSACGPFMVADCKAALDGPMLIYTRFPKLLIADCGYWSMTTWNALYCKPLLAVTSACRL